MYPKTFFATAQIRTRAGKCFVAMPFSERFDEVYETIREAVEGQELSFTCLRADELRGGGHIIEDILRGIAECEIVIADLTGRNPNVFYELGIAQMVKNVEKVILISQDIESVPFDVRVFRCILYQQTIHGATELKRALIAGIRSAAEMSFRFVLREDATYKFPQKVMGPENYAYDFAISHCFFAINGAKFKLRVTRYAAGESPEVTFEESFGLWVGEKRGLPGLDWDVEIESLDGANKTASFLVQRHYS